MPGSGTIAPRAMDGASVGSDEERSATHMDALSLEGEESFVDGIGDLVHTAETVAEFLLSSNRVRLLTHTRLPSFSARCWFTRLNV